MTMTTKLTLSAYGNGGSWFLRLAEKAAKNDALKMSDRGGEVAAVVALLLMTGFFVYHQISQTGFFTSDFGLRETVLFYAPVPTGIATSLLKAATGRKNVARPVEMVSSALMMIAGFWLFTIYPFEASHLGDALPLSLGFLLSWIPNTVLKALLLLVGVVSAARLIYLPVAYLLIRRDLASIRQE
jgi:hypothetical protein